MHAQSTTASARSTRFSLRVPRGLVGALTLTGALLALGIELEWLVSGEGATRRAAGVCLALGLLAMLAPDSRLAVGSRIAGFAAIAVGVPAMTLTFIDNTPPNTVDRAAGFDAIGTAVAVSETAFTAADTAVLIGARDTAVAYPAGSLAASLDAPLLLTSDSSLRRDVVTELQRLGVTRAIVVGDALSAHIERRLEWLGIAATRIPGSGVAVAAAVAPSVGSSSMVMLLAERGTEAAAAAAVAIVEGVPIVWATADGVPPETAAVILDQKPARMVVPSPTRAIRDDVRQLGVAVTTRLPVDHVPETTAWLASGDAPMDVAVAAAAAAARGADLSILSERGQPALAALPQPLRRYAEVVVVGGTAAITEEMLSART